MRIRGLACLAVALTVSACRHQVIATAPVKQSLEEWIAAQRSQSWAHLQKVVSPSEPKRLGDPPPLPGIVVAALSKKDPDYYFHWIRDSAHVMATLAGELETKQAYVDVAKTQRNFADFFSLSRRLQKLSSPYSLGEPRYTVNGEIDPLKWSRPQYDGPALRALATLAYLRLANNPTATIEFAKALVRTDLNYVARIFGESGFDVWEELRAENYQTRVAQLAALSQGAEWFTGNAHSSPTLTRQIRAWRRSADHLAKQLETHWSSEQKYLRSQLKITATDGYTAKHTDLDSAVVIAVLDGELRRGPNSIMDDRVQATVLALEKLFTAVYPLNFGRISGLVYGRYKGDVYFGGNPWFLITAYYARFYYNLAEEVANKHSEFILTELNREFVQSVDSVSESKISLARFAQHLMARGDAILDRLQQWTPADGQLYEQFDKQIGAPVSSKGIGWAHAEYLNAFRARDRAIEALKTK